MIRACVVICCAALLAGCAYARTVRDYFVDPEAYWSNKAIADCREAEDLREYHQRCLINNKRKLRSPSAALPDRWEQVCEAEDKAYLTGKEQCEASREAHRQALGQ